MLRLEPRTAAPWWLGVAAPILAVVATMLVGGLLFALMGFDPVAAIPASTSPAGTSASAISASML